MEVFGSSGVRGVVNEDLTPEFVLGIAKAMGSVLECDRAAVGRDTRLSGPMLVDAAASGLASVGVSVDRVGVVPTPSLQAYAAREGVPAVMITASHNPPRYNGMKLIGRSGVELGVGELEAIEGAFRDGAYDPVDWPGVGRSRRIEGVNRAYTEELVAAVDRDRIAGGGLRVAVDPGHGAGALTTPYVLRALGCEVVTLHSEPDGSFPGRNPEPIPENLGGLCRLVEAAGADVGVAHDGDADRAIFIDQDGEYIEGDAVLAAFVGAVAGPDDVVVSGVNVSQRVVDAAEEAGARLELTPIGSTRIISRVEELVEDGERVPVAGEGNGGIVFPAFRAARDGGYTACRFLELLAGGTAREVVAPFDEYDNVRVDLGYGSREERDRYLAALDAYVRGVDAAVTEIDGYRLDYGDGWVLARLSGTEPLLRIYGEARTPERAAELVAQVRGAVE